MAQIAYSINSNRSRIDGAHVAIIQGAWHRDMSDLLVKYCSDILVAHGALVRVHILPGCMELPLAAQQLALSKERPDAIVAFGIIIKGETDHYETVRDFSIAGLGRVMLDQQIPVINEILPVHAIEHAQKRCADNEFNKGIEAAHACIDILSWLSKLK
jgi:6,7-dimethyl-8-ribityllumazine synthase